MAPFPSRFERILEPSAASMHRVASPRSAARLIPQPRAISGRRSSPRDATIVATPRERSSTTSSPMRTETPWPRRLSGYASGARQIAPKEPRDPCERRECEPLKPAWGQRALHLLLELACEEGELEGLWDAAEHRPPTFGQHDRGLEELLH